MRETTADDYWHFYNLIFMSILLTLMITTLSINCNIKILTLSVNYSTDGQQENSKIIQGRLFSKKLFSIECQSHWGC